MLDWDSLMPSAGPEVGQGQAPIQGQAGHPEAAGVGHGQSTTTGAAGQGFTPQLGQSVPPCPSEKAACPTQLGQRKANAHAGFGGFVPVVPVVPVKKQGAGYFDTAGAAGRPLSLRAQNDGQGSRYALNPAAVALLLAWCERAEVTQDERLAALDGLATLPPGEQVQAWASQCQAQRLNPWTLLHPVAPQEGMDCSQCAHLVSQQFNLEGSRRRFHWCCALGYQIHEYARGAERVWIAPPECGGYERWYPTATR